MQIHYQQIDGDHYGEVDLPTLPTPGQRIAFAEVRDDAGEAIEFEIVSATWFVERGPRLVRSATGTIGIALAPPPDPPGGTFH